VTDETAANVSCAGENAGSGVLVVNVGRTRVKVASVITVARAVAAPSALNSAIGVRTVATRRDNPTIPLHVIMRAANTVSLARAWVSSGDDTISKTISPTSMTVTATASTSDPNGSPTRRAMTSAWWTAARTAAAREIPAIAT
jgi:hypothetical protein